MGVGQREEFGLKQTIKGGKIMRILTGIGEERGKNDFLKTRAGTSRRWCLEAQPMGWRLSD